MNVVRPPNCDGAAFEQRYRDDPDPWHFATSAYEQDRYSATLRAMPRPRYGAAFEPGCSVGELTVRLATICDHVLATDIAPSAVDRARRRCGSLSNVEVRCADLATDIPAETFDLIVFSEIGYYFPAPQLVRTAVTVASRLTRGGDFVAVHWLGDSVDHILHGDVVHESLLAALPLRWLHGERYAGFRIDAWRRP